MTGDREAVRRIFLEVADLDGVDRAGRLDQLCGSDAELRGEVESLLRHDRPDQEPGPSAARRDPDDVVVMRASGDEVGVYRLESRLGAGGFGEVWTATQADPIRRTVAIKLLHVTGVTGMSARFHAERQVLATLRHPRIARIIDAGTLDDGTPWFAMDLVDGRPILEAAGSLELDESSRIRVFLELCEAVASAHRRGVIHLDLSPRNVLLGPDDDGTPRPTVIDFGLARWRDVGDSSEHHVHGGTPGWMAPEQRERRADLDTRVDIWALGKLLEMLVGAVVPERGRRRREFDWIVDRATARDRDDRYESVDALARECRRWASGDPLLETGPETVVRRLEAAIRRRRRTAVTASIAVVALTIGLAVAIWQANTASQERDRATATLAFVRSLFGSVDPTEASVIDPGPWRAVLADAIARAEIPDDPATEAEIRREIATFARLVGDAPLAAEHLSRVVEIERDRFGAGSEDVRRAQDRLASALYAAGRLPQAEAVLRELLDPDPDRWDLRDPQITGRASLLAGVLRGQPGRAAEAVRLLESLIARLPEDLRGATGLERALGRSLLRVGRADDAVPLLAAWFESARRDRSPDDPVVLQRQLAYADALVQAGRVEDAAPLIMPVVERFTAEFGPNHPQTLWARERLGDLRAAQGFRAEGLATLRSVHAARARRMPDHPDQERLKDKIRRLEADGS